MTRDSKEYQDSHKRIYTRKRTIYSYCESVETAY
ncbi:hypothetical protein SAMN05216246_1218 [Actinomyces denticolens]|uniref:Transposase n=1 Tax=Actinomyces denticolens TaxID=52767 RepID=A0ABY1IKH2_9ACTO|nr:hypothetical protein SAMN05216246_1218 [Actinomyces denticolens]SUU07700.1 Uncharacterised protein [Actinomyces denticolens]